MTGRDLINASLRLLNVVATGENASAAEFDAAKSAFNRMVDSWNLEGLTVYATTRATKVLSVGVNSYTIGPGGDIDDTPQPIRLENAALILASGGSTYETPLDVLTQERWAELWDKTTRGTPFAVHLQKAANANARGNILLYYIPSSADTLVLYLQSQLSAMGNHSDPLYLMPGYADALIYNLAYRLGIEMGSAVRAEVMAMVKDLAVETKAAILRQNAEPLEMKCDPATLTFGNRLYDIRRGW